ncbi:hypothetical protein [Roseicyclus marinus]|uniref:hypothetical protein n=1 Tax=Roseicyclus marinus TaxID=2161673 RepID=UPI00240F2677|nr:hypothetical protein [Roseicyclus marinus]MDG3040570.1 hypothetical protein [Roseicyclus marinus]
MANLMASHGATAMGRAVFTPSALAHAIARLTGWTDAYRQRALDARHLRALDARQRRDAGLIDPAAPRVAVQPGWDLRLQGLR